MPPPRRRKNAESRGREHLTPAEVEALAEAAAKLGRFGARDATMIRLAYRHGLRATEVVNLRRDQLDLDGGRLHVRRAKRGVPSTHPLSGKEIRALRRVLATDSEGIFVFMSERRGPLTPDAFLKIVARAGRAAGFAFPVHPHMLRHACGFKLANDGQDTRAIQHYLGHKNIQHTVRYTALAADRFKDFWEE
jgi:type 1 fimbriae regulatory protein FimB/type 1 fimbriae regulatory protein FimE